MNHDLDDLIQRYIDGTLSESETLALQETLKYNRELRTLYLDYICLDLALAGQAESRAGVNEILATPLTRPVGSSRWFSRRSLAAAAAGLVIGLFSASLVSGQLWRRAELQRLPLMIANGGFEEPWGEVIDGFPMQVNVWGGDELQQQDVSDGVRPKEGRHMGRLMQAKSQRQFRSVHQIVDVSEGSQMARQLELSVSFHATESKSAQRYLLRLTGFTELPDAVKPVWREVLEAATAVTQKAVTATPDSSGWQTISVRLELPAGTRSLVITIGARPLDGSDAQVEYFIDDVQANLLLPKP